MKREREDYDGLESTLGTPQKQTNKLIGSGTMGNVYLTQRGSTQVAMKVIKPEVGESFYQREVAIAQQFKNTPHVINFLDWSDQPSITIYMEYLSGGELYDRIDQVRSGTPLTTREYLNIFIGVTTGLDYIHQARVIHRDIKAENILLTSEGTPKIIDFGLSVQLPSGMDIISTGLPVGSPDYVDPQSLNAPYHYTFKSDIYSLGITMAATAMGYMPYGAPAKPEFVREGKQRPKLNKQMNTDVKTILAQCLGFFATTRPTTRNLLEQLQNFDPSQPLMK